mgnify:CR=1 FL=1
MKTSTTALIAASLALVTGTAAAQDAGTTIVEAAAASPDHSTLVAAVQAAGLAETLGGEGPFTVFAPTNAAFEALPAGTVDTLLQPENKEQLTTILTCHAVGAEVMSAALAQMIADDGGEHVVETLGGCRLTAKAEGGTVTLTDENGTVATVTTADLDQSNGVIHVIDAVLLPSLYAPIAALPRAEHRNHLLANGIHPNAAGIRLMATALGPKVRQMLG